MRIAELPTCRGCETARSCVSALVLVAFFAGCGVSVGPGMPTRRTPQTGMASWYGEEYHGRRTASGDVFDMHKLTAAHKKLRLGTVVRVTNLKNGESVIVKVNDRGPFFRGRIIDLSYAAAKKIGMVEDGIAKVRIEIVRK